MKKTILCLANSRKPNGRCVAGIEMVDDSIRDWVRPVGDSAGGAVSEADRRYENGGDPRVLDLISIPLLEHVPIHSQTENWLIDPDQYWIKKGRVSWDELANFEEAQSPIWPSEAPSTRYGQYDRTHEEDSFGTSLRLVRVDDLRLRVLAPGADFGDPKRQVLGTFTYAAEIYTLRVTDPVFERTFLAEPDGYYEIGLCYLTLSLAEPWKGYCYKLIAAIITPERSASES